MGSHVSVTGRSKGLGATWAVHLPTTGPSQDPRRKFRVQSLFNKGRRTYWGSRVVLGPPRKAQGTALGAGVDSGALPPETFSCPPPRGQGTSSYGF